MIFSVQEKEQFNQFNIHDFRLLKYSYHADNESVKLLLQRELQVCVICENVLALKFSNAGPWGGTALYINGWHMFSDMAYLLDKFDLPAREYLNIHSDALINSADEVRKIDDFFQVSIEFTSGDELQILTNKIKLIEQ